MLPNVLVAVTGLEYNFAKYLTLKGLEKAKLSLSDKLTTALISRVYRLRLDIKLVLSLVWLAIIMTGLPLEFRIWDLEFQVMDLEYQLWLFKLLSSIFQFLAYCRGFMEGTCFGLLIAGARHTLINWMALQQEKARIYYLLYRCNA